MSQPQTLRTAAQGTGNFFRPFESLIQVLFVVFGPSAFPRRLLQNLLAIWWLESFPSVKCSSSHLVTICHVEGCALAPIPSTSAQHHTGSNSNPSSPLHSKLLLCHGPQWGSPFKIAHHPNMAQTHPKHSTACSAKAWFSYTHPLPPPALLGW